MQITILVVSDRLHTIFRALKSGLPYSRTLILACSPELVAVSGEETLAACFIEAYKRDKARTSFACDNRQASARVCAATRTF
jgi:hypothetical protein